MCLWFFEIFLIRDRVVINRKLGEGAFGTVYGGEAFFDEKGWVSSVPMTTPIFPHKSEHFY